MNTILAGDPAPRPAAPPGAARPARPDTPGRLSAPGEPVPCAARPSTGFIHLDGPCRCFFGGPGPEFAPVREPEGLLTAC